MSIAANKFEGIRAANVTDIRTGIQSVEHNNANILCLGSNNVTKDLAIEMKGKVIQENQAGLDANSRTALHNDFIALRDQINTIALSAEFNENKYAKWEDIFNDLKGKVEMEVNTASEFTQNMANGFLSSKPWVATSKLIQLKFLHTVLNMKPKKRNEFLTDMVFLAAKKGKRFGPFGKLY